MAKKHILNLEYQHHFKVLGIFSPQKDYRMCWLINNHLGLELKRMPDFSVAVDKDDNPASHAIYQFEQPSMLLKILLIANKTSENILFTEPKNMDYLLLFKDPGNHQNLSQRLAAIKKISQVQAVVLLNNLISKRSSEIFFDLEMYLSKLS